MKDNYSTQEIANILGVSIRTVQNYLSDLRKSLRKGTKYNYSLLKAILAVYDRITHCVFKQTFF